MCGHHLRVLNRYSPIFHQTNIFISNDTLHRAKIADFGLTIMGEKTDIRISTSRRETGTAGWKAPELYDHADARKNPPTDIFAYACVCFQVSGDVLTRLGRLT